MTASPMNFSTVPPCASSTRFAASNPRAITSRSTAASSGSPRNPVAFRSENTIVTVLRLSRVRARAASFPPHVPQKVNSGGLPSPQLGQMRTSSRSPAGPPSARSASTLTPTSRYAPTGWVWPLGTTESTCSTVTSFATIERVGSPTSTSIAGADCSSLLARWTTSPVRMCSPALASPTTISPVAMPVRLTRRTPHVRSICSFRAASARCVSAAAATARSASSSRGTGRPNTATTASPMIFSIVPPCASNTARISSK